MTLDRLDVLWLAIFSIELLIKATAAGFATGADAYIMSGWNQLDLTIVVSSALVLLADSMVSIHIPCWRAV